MKYIKPYNESIKDYLKPKSEQDIVDSISKLTPYGAYYRIRDLDLDYDQPELNKIIDNRIKNSFIELDEIMSNWDKDTLEDLVKDVSEWVRKNGGNYINVIDGFKGLSQQISNYIISPDKYDHEQIYEESVVEDFKKLLKNFAYCEVKNNNIDCNF